MQLPKTLPPKNVSEMTAQERMERRQQRRLQRQRDLADVSGIYGANDSINESLSEGQR